MKKRWKIWMIVIALILALSIYFDNEIIKNVAKIKNVFLDEIFLGLTFISSSIIIFFFLTSLFLWQEHKRKWIFPLWLTLGITTLISFVLKIIVKRLRPFQLEIVNIIPILEKNSHLIWNFSFPSFHTALAFCAIPILSKEFPKIKWFWIIFAVLVGISRLYFGMHFLSDIILGGLIGYFVGMSIIKITSKRKKFRKKMTSFTH